MIKTLVAIYKSCCTVFIVNQAIKNWRKTLSSGWAVVGAVTWIATLLAVIAIAISSRTLSRPPWWLGPASDPAPFYAPAILVIVIVGTALAYLGSHSVAPLVGILSSLFLGIFAVADIDATIGVALAQIIVATAALLGSIATFAGIHERTP